MNWESFTYGLFTGFGVFFIGSIVGASILFIGFAIGTRDDPKRVKPRKATADDVR